MPKKSPYLLAWSPAQQAYVLSDGSSTAQLAIEPETPGWFAWLDHVPSFAFAGQSGSVTLRKERIHGEVYWYAYRRTGEKLTKKYVGKTTALTISRLEQIAGLLEAMPPGESPLFDVPGTLSSEDASEPEATIPLQKSVAHPPADVVQRDPLLFTKLHVPRPRAQLVPRPHLVERLQQMSDLTLTLVSAPAGFGKTTLLAQWLAERRMPVAWLSLEPEDNDPLRFLSYLIAALQTVQADIGTTASALLHTPQPPPLETLLAMLTNDLTSYLAGDIALVLDDYHVITASPLHQALLFLVEHCPPHLHLVLASRTDPPLPLARLRARGQLSEIRAAQLQFTQDEARLFLQRVMGLELSTEEVATLQSRTEGWIAGLHLAALSLQERPDVQQFLADFTGSHRHLIDYLVEDVLSHQSADVQSFLLHTCILDRLCSSLCEAVTDESAGQAMLERVEAAHLFLTPLDNQRQWYRYHQLFAEVLRHRLRHEAPELVPLLHQRASGWYEQQGFMREA
ncbi:MAG TPA: LuxR family transcriptional regulator, partial [Ktedonobacteraceae bacterium]|nr:LuxR family transcriptional regulator [Ktedonobacteraceae bacterium]